MSFHFLVSYEKWREIQPVCFAERIVVTGGIWYIAVMVSELVANQSSRNAVQVQILHVPFGEMILKTGDETHKSIYQTERK